MKIREVHPAGSASYVVLQMLAVGEYQIGGHHLVAYDANGSVADDFVLPNDVSPNSRNNSTVLITGPGYTAAFPSPANPTSDEPNPNLNLSPAGGAICWTEGEPPDCVAWGNFTGPLPTLIEPLLVGAPASPGGVSPGKALQRTIVPGCATLLEATDDSNVSASDFSEVTPNPRNNATPKTETDCVTPDAKIETRPANPTKTTSASFSFSSNPPGAEFECKLDSGAFEECLSDKDLPFVYPGPLADGSHTFQVRAKNTQGPGPSAVYTWLVDTQPPATTITSSPANPSSGSNVTFAYESSQLSSAFECSVAPQGLADSFTSCPTTGMVYPSLADSIYTFKVRATDKAGNQGLPAAHTWEVRNSAGGGAGGASPPPPLAAIPLPLTRPAPPATVRCKKGFVKKKVKGKMRCVKKPKKKKKKKQRSGNRVSPRS